jgi:GH25 family lysozyme M1 (1,4-beta-N-acetylmuramidase)
VIKPSAPPLPKGIDVASFQHPGGAAIDWPQVAAAGYSFAAVKATEGDYYANPYYASDVSAAKAAGLYVTGYHFAIPNVSPGAAQADYAVSHGSYTADGRTLPLELDVEYDPYVGIDHTNECYGLTPAEMVSWIGAFDAEAERLTGQAPVIYTTADWWDTCTGNSAAFGSDPLWVAAYADASPPLPAGRDDWTFWQYASSGTVPGVATAGDTDVSYFGGGLVTLVDPGSQRTSEGTSVSLQLGSLNAAAGQSLSFTASGLPPGLAISDRGQITGTIATKRSGSYPVQVTATGPAGVTGTVSFTWDVSSRADTGGPVHR